MPSSQGNSPQQGGCRLAVVVQRQLDVVSTGNGAYLEMFLRAARLAGLKTTLVFAPWRSFGNRPWAYFHPRFGDLSDRVDWPRSIRLGNWFLSPSPLVWWRFLVRLSKAGLRVMGLSPKVYSFLGDPLNQKEAQIVAQRCNQANADISVSEYSSLGPILQLLNGDSHKGVLLHDLFSDRCQRFRENNMEPDFLEISADAEADWVKAADFCVYASANEMKKFAQRMPNAQALWLKPEPPVYQVSDAEKTPRVVYLGTTHAGNEDALNHFVDKVWPKVIAQEPTAMLSVVGSIGRCLNPERRQQPGVKVLGRIDDLASIGGPDSIGVAPTRLATGVSIKVAEYLALGMPSVVYPLALEGFDAKLDDLVQIVTDPNDFAKTLLSLFGDREARKQLSKIGLEGIKTRLSNQEIVDYLQHKSLT